MSINVTWLKNHTPDADAMTDLSGVSGLSALGADSSASDVSGLDSLAADSDQDLAGFEDARPAASADDESPPGRATKPTAKPSHRPPFMSPIQDVDSPSKEMGTPGVGERAARDSVGERWTAAATKLGSPAPSPSSTRKRMLLKYESPIKASSNDAEAAGSGIGRTARALFQGVLFATHLGTKSGRGDPSVAAALREELDAVEDVRQLVKSEVAMQEEVDAAAEAAEEAKAEGMAEAKTDAEAEAKKDPSPESTLAASHQETPSADAFAEATAAAEAAREEAASLREQLEETSAVAAAADSRAGGCGRPSRKSRGGVISGGSRAGRGGEPSRTTRRHVGSRGGGGGSRAGRGDRSRGARGESSRTSLLDVYGVGECGEGGGERRAGRSHPSPRSREENSRACATVCPFARVRRMGVAREPETAPSRVGATRNGASDEKREGDDVSRVAANRAREHRGSGLENRSRGGGESPRKTLARPRGAERTVSPRPHASQTPTRVRVVVYDDARVATTNSRRDENSRACATVCPFARVRRMGVARERETAPWRNAQRSV